MYILIVVCQSQMAMSFVSGRGCLIFVPYVIDQVCVFTQSAQVISQAAR